MARLIFGVHTFVLIVIFSSLYQLIHSQSPSQLGEIINNVDQPTHGTLSPTRPTPATHPQPTLGRSSRNVTNLSMRVRRRRRAAMIREFLFEHNKIRAQLGERPLKWDKMLARYAERFANKRKSDCILMHSNTTIYGENVYRGEHYERHTAANAVRAWASESQFYHPLSNSCQPNQMCGHYTQIIWRNTKRLGCSRMKCNNGGVYIICDYDPPGNYRNESPFTTPLSVD
ncbi:Pathogenesis-related protein [Thalictrum thalictroides]|uniref:Pathogenesis-related protein n=1 Tax=Thalictrum thalictroides TaxID=46969 RepID=A0A7J6WA98_THATH|nr:Pathogenesis-related protein [Thalictrum thalictroides]